jgi:hypothetical protein
MNRICGSSGMVPSQQVWGCEFSAPVRQTKKEKRKKIDALQLLDTVFLRPWGQECQSCCLNLLKLYCISVLLIHQDFCFPLVGFESRALCMLGKHSTSASYPWLKKFIIYFWGGPCYLAWLASNSSSSCFSFLNSWDCISKLLHLACFSVCLFIFYWSISIKI